MKMKKRFVKIKEKGAYCYCQYKTSIINIYEVSDRYEIKKTGKAELKLTNTSDITLITCISGTDKQVVYVATLIAKENY